MTLRGARRLLVALALVAGAARGAGDRVPVTDPVVDPAAILVASKEASGGAAWDGLRTQHTTVTLLAGRMAGTGERWTDLATGRSLLRFTLGPMSGAVGFDGTAPWTQDAAGQSRVDSADAARELAVNAAYRDQLAFWYPERHAATLRHKGQARADGATFDVISITPSGGREFELWINAETRLIERLVEQEAWDVRTEVRMDFRLVAGVLVPFRVRSTRGDPKGDEVVTVDTLAYNVALDGVRFARPVPPAPDYVFPAGKAAVEVPFDVHSGHAFVSVKLNGRGPFLMLFDAAGVNVLTPESAAALGLGADGALAHVGDLEIGGIRLANPVFATVDMSAFMRRVDGIDNVAGVVGHELLKRFPVTIDYGRSRLVFHEPATFAYADTGTRVPLRFKGRMPQAEGAVDGIPGHFDIDTGSRGALTLAAPFAEKHGLASTLGATREIIFGAGMGGYARALLGRAGMLRLGTVDIAKPVTYVTTAAQGAFADPDLAGNVGYLVLRRFDITFDFARNEMWMKRNANDAQPDVHDRAGAWIERGPAGYVVVEVVAGGPAEQAGLKAGDVIVAIDGQPVRSVPLGALRLRLKGPPGTRVRLDVEGGGARLVTLRDLV